MFFETSYNVKKFSSLPCLLMSACSYYRQEPIWRKSGTSYHQFLWVVEGECRLEIDGRNITLLPGQGFYRSAGIAHRYEGEGLVTGWFSFAGAEGIFAQYQTENWFLFDAPPWLAAQVEACQRSTPIARSSAVYMMITELMESIFQPQESLVGRVDRYLEQHFAEDLSLDTVADEVGLSRYALCHSYGESGRTVMEKLKQIRLANAKMLLRSTALPVSEVAGLCGYAAHSYFGKLFRESVGLSPLQYRQKERAERN